MTLVYVQPKAHFRGLLPERKHGKKTQPWVLIISRS